MAYLWIKVLHIVAVISWMAGMLYLPRLFVYHCDAVKGGEAADKFCVMERRLLRGIMTPAAVVSVLAGLWLAWVGDLWADPWFHAKMLLVAILIGIHVFLWRQVRAFAVGQNRFSDKFYRVINEIPALLMVGIVALVVIRPWG
ncbi:protoporphyrinogen oxidase HemJ [Camelimonas abortus]|uniref:Protoporphyrinogen IX oxidase n=1 Tax=Camelimonas abortus TaxID=1017184 RepID=A0ABV7LC02_9HYPH